MPAIIANAKKFLFNGDYPIDKIILIKSGSFTVPGSSSGTTESIAHGLPFIPLCGGNWSLTSDFSVAYEYSIGTFPNTTPFYPFKQVVNIQADSTNIVISADNDEASSKTIYYRVFCFQPDSDNSDIDPSTSGSDPFVLNTDYNYSKLFMSGSTTLADNSSSSSPLITPIYHGLGYIPQAMGWAEGFLGFIVPVGSSASVSTGIAMIVNSTYINFVTPAYTGSYDAYYRLYLDD